jgi:hypothetical protein
MTLGPRALFIEFLMEFEKEDDRNRWVNIWDNSSE